MFFGSDLPALACLTLQATRETLGEMAATGLQATVPHGACKTTAFHSVDPPLVTGTV